MRTQATAAALRDRVAELMPRIRADLETLVRIPSISHPGHDPSQLRRSAEATLKILSAAGCAAKIVEIEGVPAVLGHVAAPAGAPTVLLYAHHDVQPTGARDLWHSDPFEPVEKNGRLYGRGTSDDKCGVVMHAGALLAHDSRPPVGVRLFIEGEEEWGSPNLAKFLERHGDELRADAVILADSGNWRPGQPGLTTSLRGIVACDVEVRTLDHAVHSGEFGGPVPDALTVLAKTLATLHDERGNVAVEGIARGKADPLDLSEDELRKQVGMRRGVKLIGEGGITDRMWMKPAVSILGIDAPRLTESTNQLVPSAKARVSMRIPPGQDPSDAMKALAEHLRSHVPWGADVTVTERGAGKPYKLHAEGRAYDAMRRAMSEAFGREPVFMGAGGTIPFVADFAKAFPQAGLLLTGAGDPFSNAHSEDESVDLADLERSTLAEALFFEYLAPH
ncbi:MAG TPA: dipeptidase [Candidatus Limnocylindria bacterium]|jgi:acetylornithine deacetylase/succinyl-diaminopimelate desuccinylase-like protein|nr:dipeptidase [Candidatus Limnocylindria bacterium]